MNASLIVRCAFVLSVALLALSWLLGGQLPLASQINSQLLREPLQSQTFKKPFTATVKNIEYRIRPIADYDMVGVVVSRHDSAAWWDWIHAASNDHLNVADLCVVWGHNVQTDNYREFDYSSGQFVCYVKTKSDKVWREFDLDALSNNHLLTDDRSIAKKLLSLKIGDQVRIKGWLSEYAHSSGFKFQRGTSLVRTDRGNGACETIFVSSVELIQPASRVPQFLKWFGIAGLLLAFFGWIYWVPATVDPE